MASQTRIEPDLGAGDGLLTRFAKKRPVLTFLLFAYALGWGMATPRILTWLGLVSWSIPNWWVAASFFAPATAALIVQWLAHRNFRVCRLYDTWPRLLVGVVAGPLVVLVLNAVVPALLAERDPLHTLNWPIFLSLAPYHIQLLQFLTPIGEEVGWRGLALPRLQEQFGPAWASVLVGLMWAAFALPALIFVQMWSGSAIVVYAVNLIALSVEMTWAANLSGFSIVVAVIMHELASNQSSYLSRALTAHAYPRPHWEQFWAVGILVVPALLLVLTRGRLGARRTDPSSVEAGNKKPHL